MSRRHILPFLAAAVVLATMTGSAHGQAREDWRATEEGDKSQPENKSPEPKPQSYGGVTPGSGNNLPRVDELKGKPGTWVTWPGFAMRPDGGSRLFLQSTVTLVFNLVPKKKTIELKLDDAQVFLSNNRNPLVTTHFNTPLKRAYLKKRRDTVSLVLELKVEASPEITQMVDQDGYYYMFVDFPPGSYPILEEEKPRLSFDGNEGAQKSSNE